jgi:leucyl aminopeptidase
MTSIALTAAPVTTLDVDALIVGITANGKKRIEGPPALPADVRTSLEKSVEALGATGKFGEITRIPGAGLVKARMIVAVGLGDMRILDYEKARRIAGAALRSLAGSASVAIVVTAPDGPRVEAIAEGALLGNYAFHAFRGASAASQPTPVQRILITGDPKDKEQAAGSCLGQLNSRTEALDRALRRWTGLPGAKTIQARICFTRETSHY